MAEIIDQWANDNKKNVFGNVCSVRQMQSEGGAAGALHGGLVAGGVSTTFTASQGLLLMIPNMYKISGELIPCVFHVSARAIAGQALSIFGDHSDVMAVRQCGWAMLASVSVQDSQDIALVSHIATLNARVPFVHFFDGFRTSHEMQKVKQLSLEAMKSVIPMDKVREHRERGMNPLHPNIRGTAQGSDIFFQAVEASNSFYNDAARHIQDAMDVVSKLTGRPIGMYEYKGHAQAEDIVCVMGSAAPVLIEAVDYLVAKGQKVGVITVKMFRPWSLERFADAVPKTVKSITILDRCKEAGALGEPLFLDVATSMIQSGRMVKLFGGRYGLASKDFTPPMAIAVFENMKGEGKTKFTVGINDDVTHMSLPYEVHDIETVPQGTRQCLFWGMGSDGTVGANKNVVKIIGMQTPLYAQAYFAYSAHKAGGITVSHLRFGPKPITSQYLIQKADYIAVHRSTYVKEFKILANAAEGATFVLNCCWSRAELETELPGSIKRTIANKKIQFYTIDAHKVAKETKMGRRINNILMAAFFKLSGVLEYNEAIAVFKEAIKKTYGRKGQAVVDANYAAVDAAAASLVKVEYDVEAWKTAALEVRAGFKENAPEFVTNILGPASVMEGDTLPVSQMAKYVGGVLPMGTAEYEKRGIALQVPVVDMDKCTQCNYCAFVCPHAAIRPFLLNEDEAEAIPEELHLDLKKAKGSGAITAFKYRIQVTPLDCTGCELCARACPDDALTMTTYEDVVDLEKKRWDVLEDIPERGELLGADIRKTLKGSQFHRPLIEFSGACEGCGETPYLKLLTQLFGERTIIANATGCSSVYGASFPSVPYTTTREGRGPAWANSLFEDNAEFGYGMVVATNHRREHLLEMVKNAIDEGVASEALMKLLVEWKDDNQDALFCERIWAGIKGLLEEEKDKSPALREVYNDRDLIIKPSQWIIGGDGWAFDIGFGGLDHVVSTGENVNICILDTEVYSNTGGQVSKATPMGAVHKFAAGGLVRNKKDLNMMMVEYGTVYVASCALLANMSQTVRAFVEAEAFNGPSIIHCYCPCIEHGYIKPFAAQQEHVKLAVESGYWPLYRYNPALESLGENPFQLDQRKLKGSVAELVRKENRFSYLRRSDEKAADYLEQSLENYCRKKFKLLQARAEGVLTGLQESKAAASKALEGKMLLHVAYGSETGNAEGVARRIAKLGSDRGMVVKLEELNDFDVDAITEMDNLIIVISTAGQGELPGNSKELYQLLCSSSNEPGCMSKLKYAVFGLGDSSYIYFNKAAIMFDDKLAELGGTRVMSVGLGDDQHDEMYDTVLADWLPDYWTESKAPPLVNVSEDPDPPMFKVTPSTGTHVYTQTVPKGTALVEVTVNRRMTPEDYDVDVRHLEFNLGESGFRYALGDSLAIYPMASQEDSDDFCRFMGYEPEEWVIIQKAAQEVSAKHEALLKSPMQIRQIISEVLDVFGKPNRLFYELLYKYCTDPTERATAKALLEKENKEYMKSLTHTEMVSVYDMFKKFKSARPTLAQLIDLVQLVKPRYYSICSSQKFVGLKKLELCVGIVDWKVPDSSLRYGACTGMLRRLEVTPDQKVFLACSLKATAFNMPPTDMHPIILSGMGTGLAPFRAFIQYRTFLKRQGKKVGPVTVYFGCRHRAKDYLYGEEMEALHAEGIITDLRVAFSRDQKEKFYVQHHITKDPELLHKRLLTEEGYFYLCGSAKQVPIDIRNAVIGAITHCKGGTTEEADQLVTDLQIKGRYNVEAW